jgi:hypothetical protein
MDNMVSHEPASGSQYQHRNLQAGARSQLYPARQLHKVQTARSVLRICVERISRIIKRST